ncbi:MAG: hypothetical protein M3680_24200 [Myxococcota bacterium]|nr:hypothetical protein [Myxococcota bacterium]
MADNALPPLERIEVENTRGDRALSHGEPSKPILGLPLARLIPQDVHAIMDYSNGLLAASCAMVADDPRAKLASVVLAGSVIGVSVITDYRLSVAKVVPIEAHEVIDHVWGLSAIAAPFVFGYYKTEPKIAMMHIVAGAGTILGSLLTDYRAYKRRRGV